LTIRKRQSDRRSFSNARRQTPTFIFPFPRCFTVIAMIATTVPTKKVSGPGHTLEKRERPHQLVLIHRNTLNRERTSQTEVLSIDDIRDRVSVSTQESSSLRSKPKVHVGKTIRKRKQTSQKEVPVLKAAKVLELGECASALGFQCKCPQQCSGNFTTFAIQEFRKNTGNCRPRCVTLLRLIRNLLYNYIA